ncbi:MAG: D-glycerate dehydrogenase [SAR202 cluster bacterium]|jgi:glyoxylate reductase|nr:D-glycerate dehydrogenase [SAR202 cluster bacterium]
MSLPKVFVTRIIPPEAQEILNRVAEIEIWPQDTKPPQEVIIQKAAECIGLFTTIEDQINSEVLQSGKDSLKIVSNYAVGYDNFDIDTATKNGIIMCNTPDVLSQTTADLAFGLMLSIARNIVKGDNFVRSGKWTHWHPSTLLGRDIYGANLLVVGLGRIGLEVCRRAIGFGMEIFYHSRTRKLNLEKELGINYVSKLKDGISKADFISINTIMNDQTYHLFGKEEFNTMKNSAIIVNTARGPIIDMESLYEALKNNQIAGAAVDVTEPEPIPNNHPILSLENFVVTPHIGSASIETRKKMAIAAAKNIEAYLLKKTIPSSING